MIHAVSLYEGRNSNRQQELAGPRYPDLCVDPEDLTASCQLHERRVVLHTSGATEKTGTEWLVFVACCQQCAFETRSPLTVAVSCRTRHPIRPTALEDISGLRFDPQPPPRRAK